MPLFQRSLYGEDPSFSSLFRLLDDFESVTRGAHGQRGGRHVTFNPRFDVRETEAAYELHGELPGVERKDVQIEFVMIDPYLRLNLQTDGKGRFTSKFQIPDVYGVFKFRLQYHKLGWSNVDLEQQVSVHPYRHDQFERFLDVAYPYYLSTICNMVAFFLFGIIFLYNTYA